MAVYKYPIVRGNVNLSIPTSKTILLKLTFSVLQHSRHTDVQAEFHFCLLSVPEFKFD